MSLNNIIIPEGCLMTDISNILLTIETEAQRSEYSQNMKTAIAKKDHLLLNSLAKQRTENPAFRQALEQRDELKECLVPVKEDIEIAKGKKPGENGKKNICWVDVRTHSRKYRDIAEVLIVLEKRIDEYKELTAQIIKHSSTLRKTLNAHNLQEYTAEQLGEFIKEQETDRKNIDYRTYKMGGIGGSDIAKILYIHPDKQKARENYKKLLMKKCGIEEDDDMTEHITFSVNRGNLWEKSILIDYSDQHPEKNIAECNVSWIGAGEYSYYRARFDGLELDNDGKPVGIIEIKTGIKEEQWGTENTLNSIPENYMAQTIWYAKNAGLNKATIIALLDDYEIREYTIDMNDPKVLEKWQIMKEKVQEFWAEVLLNRAALSVDEKHFENKQSRGFSKSIAPKNQKEIAEKITAYSGEDFDKIHEIVHLEISKIKIRGQETPQETIQKILTKIYASHDPKTRRKPLIGIDLETNSFSKQDGRIIETGIVVSYPDGKQSIEFNSVHGLTPLTEAGHGVGKTAVHRITLEQTFGKPLFEDEENQQKILALLKKGTIVAHNASFERESLVVNLDGFAELLDNNEIEILDTMQICRNLMPDAENSKLSTFAEENGVAYEGAHNAITDTVIMMKALRNFQEGLYKNKKFVKKNVSTEERKTAITKGLENDTNR